MSLKDRFVLAGVIALGVGILAAGVHSLSRTRTSPPRSNPRGSRPGAAGAAETPRNPQDARTPIAADGRGGSISGSVVDAKGAEVGDAVVSAFTFDGAVRLAGRVWTGGDGLFLLSGLAPGLYTVEARKEGVGVAVQDRIFVEPDFVTPVFALRLAPGAKVEFRTTPRARIRLYAMQTMTERTSYSRTWEEKIADDEGRATFDGIPDGTYGANLSCEGFAIENVSAFPVRDGRGVTIEKKLRKR